jgi:hypothetical protein
VDWLSPNFLKTELELGHCLRLPAEGPCECDLYLSCAKFVTTPHYATRLRRRHRLEQTRTDDARTRGWDREVQRHQATAARIQALLTDLGEPLDCPGEHAAAQPARAETHITSCSPAGPVDPVDDAPHP